VTRAVVKTVLLREPECEREREVGAEALGDVERAAELARGKVQDRMPTERLGLVLGKREAAAAIILGSALLPCAPCRSINVPSSP